MAIVEDEVRNDSEEENEIEVYVEEDDGDQDSDDSDDDDDDEEVAKRKIADLEQRIEDDPYNYEDHIALIQELWKLPELEKWRAAFDRLHQTTVLHPEDWLLRLETEVSLAHTPQSYEFLINLFHQALCDGYYIPILSLWCTWAISTGSQEVARAQIEEVLKRAGADPFSGKLFWDARLELEKTQLESLSKTDADYKTQKERVLWCLEETVSRPLLRAEDAWQAFHELALELHDKQYVDKVKEQHDAAVEYLQKITPYEDKLLTIDDAMERCKVFQEYIVAVKDLSKEDKYEECGGNDILKVLYERVTTELSQQQHKGASDWQSGDTLHDLLSEYVSLVKGKSSKNTIRRVLECCVRRCFRRHTFWTLSMQQAEQDGKEFNEVKSIFEMALTKVTESYKHAESLWMSYLTYCRRKTDFENETEVERLRRTFRLAWDSLAEVWGEDANDCEVPLYWAQMEYKRMGNPKQGKEIFEEIFKYGENKTMSKYWEALLHLESAKGGSESKLRDLHRRALGCVQDYPPAVARLWQELERAGGQLESAVLCAELCEAKLKEWRKNYEAMKQNMMGSKQKGKHGQNKKSKLDNKKKSKGKQEENKLKRKSDDTVEADTEVKKKKDNCMEVDEKPKVDTGGGSKRPHGDDEDKDTKRPRTESGSSGTQQAGREACTLFVSNLEFKVNEDNLRDKLSQYGDIVSMRVRAGVKAFGGSICYCQYKSPESVEQALKHDRTPLDGRPMFLSRYSATKSKASFKYPTTAEKNKLFVRNLPFADCTKEALTGLFQKYGTLNDVRIVTHKDGKPKGLAYIEYADEASACEAVKGANGLILKGREISVALSEPPPKSGAALPAADSASAPPIRTRRTQLSSFIPSVLQKPSCSKASTGNGDHATAEKHLTNADFRSMLLKK